MVGGTAFKDILAVAVVAVLAEEIPIPVVVLWAVLELLDKA